MLKPIHRLVVADQIQLPEGAQPFHVTSIDGQTGPPEGRRRVHVRSADGARQIVLVRDGRELVRIPAGRP